MRILLLTAGSRGDVDPFLALADRASATAPPVPLGALPAATAVRVVADPTAHDDGCGAALDVVERICDR